MEIISKNPLRIIGTLCPSSPWLSKAMVSIDDFTRPNMSILEIGAGTGAVTKEIIKKMNQDQILDIVEIMPSFSKILSAKFNRNSFVSIYNKDVRLFDEKKKYDLIFSSLPFNAFSSSILKQVIEKIISLSKPNTKMAFFEYKWSKVLAPLFLSKKEKQDFYISRKIIDDFIGKYSYNKISVNVNIPPAYVYFLSLSSKE